MRSAEVLLKTLARKVLSRRQRRLIKRAIFGRILHRKNLPALSLAFGTDKHGQHFYAKHYGKHFATLRTQRLNILEIGVGGYSDADSGGASLRVWKAYFRKARIHGLDIYDKRVHDEPRIKTHIGSQTDAGCLKSLAAEIGRLDIVIDDGSHHCSDVIATFKVLFPLLANTGIYVVEDLQASYWTNVAGISWGGSRDLTADCTSMNFFKALVDGLNHQEFMDPDYDPTYFDRHIVSMHFYHNLLFIYKGLNDEPSNIDALSDRGARRALRTADGPAR